MIALRNLLGFALLSAGLSGCISDPTGPGNSGVLSAISGNGQVGPVNSTLPAALVVQARNADGSSIAGLEISWEVAAAAGPGASLSSSSGTTDAIGQASVQITLGTVAGGYMVRAIADGGSAEFVVIASTVVFGVDVVSGSGQVGVTGSVLSQPLVALVTGPDGSLSAGVDITFSILLCVFSAFANSSNLVGSSAVGGDGACPAADIPDIPKINFAGCHPGSLHWRCSLQSALHRPPQ